TLPLPPRAPLLPYPTLFRSSLGQCVTIDLGEPRLPRQQLGQTGSRKRGSPGRPRNEEQHDDDADEEGADARAQGRETGGVEHDAGGQGADGAAPSTQQVRKSQRRASLGRGRDVTDHRGPTEIGSRPAQSDQEEPESTQRRL